jgi:cell division septal protein FtsQ
MVALSQEERERIAESERVKISTRNKEQAKFVLVLFIGLIIAGILIYQFLLKN